MSNSVDGEKLLSDKRVIAEIQRHLWIESEKAGRDIGFDKAKEDWLKNFSKAWMRYNWPSQTGVADKGASDAGAAKAAVLKRRRAKSYFKF